MLQLLQPIWLSVLSAIAVPIAIHLWNKTPGRVLRVGSTALMQDLASSRKKSLLLSEKLLLLLRCLLIASIAFALANPQWKYTPKTDKGWVLIPRGNTGPVYHRFHNEINALLEAGNRLRYFEEGFPPAFLKDIDPSAAFKTDDSLSYRSTITALNNRVDTSFPVFIFTDDLLYHFQGDRTPVVLNLQWSAWHPNLSVPEKVNDSLTISIYTQHYPTDARYLRAAFAAISETGVQPLRLVTANKVRDIPGQSDWLFWLEEDVSNMPAAKNTLVYAGGKVSSAGSYLLPEKAGWSTPIDLRRRIADTALKTQDRIWKDGFGNTLLSRSMVNSQQRYKLFTHFNPEWNGLVWDASFPSIMTALVNQKSSAATNSDARFIGLDSSQLLPPKANAVKKSLAASASISLSGFCWIVTLIILLAERLLSFYQHKRRTNG